MYSVYHVCTVSTMYVPCPCRVCTVSMPCMYRVHAVHTMVTTVHCRVTTVHCHVTTVTTVYGTVYGAVPTKFGTQNITVLACYYPSAIKDIEGVSLLDLLEHIYKILAKVGCFWIRCNMN